MITYKGIKKTDKISYIIFSNEKNNEIEIPVEPHIAQRFAIYLDKIAIPTANPVERGNDEPSE